MTRAANVQFPNGPMPLTRLNPWYPGQFGVPGAWTETGLRMHPTGAVFWVDPNHVDANDQRDGTDPTAPLATVERALALCQAYRGDVVAIAANDFLDTGPGDQGYTLPVQESVTVTVPGVRIVGLSQSNSLGCYWIPAAADGVCITVHATDVLVEGIAFLGDSGGTGILAEWDGADTFGDNMTVRNCFFNDDLDEGIVTDFSWWCNIHGCTFDECHEYGIYTDPATGDPAYWEIYDNWFHDIVVTAISLEDGDRHHIHHNNIYNNDAATNDVATPANCMIDLTGGSRNQVHHNTLSCVLPAAVAWDYDAVCTAGAGDAWIQNYLRDGVSVTNPA
jgi:hypothetical protein